MTALARFFIVLPVHNGGEYLPQAVQSVLTQTVGDWHLMILENSSNDGTTAWLKTLTDPRISVHASAELLSIEANWQRILDLPCGEFLMLLGHDDLLDPWYLEEIATLIEKEPEASLYQTQFRLIDGLGKTLRSASSQPTHETAAEFLGSRLQRQRESFGTGYMMRWRDYLKVGGIPEYPGLIFADDALWLQLTHLSYKVTSLKECFAYRVHAVSSSALAAGDIHLGAMERYLPFLKKLSLEDKDISQILINYRDYFLWHAHQAYAIDLTRATQRNERLDESVVRRYNALLSSVAPTWSLKTNRTRSLKVRENINRFVLARVAYNFYQHLRKQARKIL